MKNNTSFSPLQPATVAGTARKMKNNHCTGVLKRGPLMPRQGGATPNDND